MLDHCIRISSNVPYVMNDKEDGRRTYVFTVYSFIEDKIIESINEYCINVTDTTSFSNIENLRILVGDKDPYFLDRELASYYKSHKYEINYLKNLEYNIRIVEEVIEYDIVISIVVNLDFPDFSSKDISILHDEHFEYPDENYSMMVKRFSKNKYKYTDFSSFDDSIKAVINYFSSVASDPFHRLVLYCPKCGTDIPGTIEYINQDIDKNYICLDYKKCKCGGNLVEIDELMINIVKAANKRGYTTLYCCSGHNITDQIYITFLDKPSITRNIIKGVSEDISMMKYFDISHINNYHGISIEYRGNRYFDGIGVDYRKISYSDFVQHRAKVLQKLYEFIDTLPNISQEEKEEEK